MAATTAIPVNRVRIAGAGLTIFTFAGQPITFCEQVQHTSPRPVAQFSAIQPMDEPYPVEILAPPAAGPGQLVLNMFELFGTNGAASKVWDRLGLSFAGGGAGLFGSSDAATSQYLNYNGTGGIFGGAVDIVDVFIRQAQASPDQMGIVKIIRPLGATSLANPNAHYTEEYIGCQIVDVVDGEQVAIGTVEVIKQITVAYRYLTRDGNTSAAFALRGGARVTPNSTNSAV